MKRFGFLAIAAWFAVAELGQAQQEIYVEEISSTEVLKTAILRGFATPSVVAFSTTEKTAKVLDAATLKERSNLTGLTSPISLFALSVSGQALIAATADGQVGAWNTSTGVLTKVVYRESRRVTALAVQDETLVYLASDDKKLRILDALSGRELGSLPTSVDEVTGITIHPNGKDFALGTMTGQVRVYSLSQLAVLKSLAENKDRITTIMFSPGGNVLAAGTASGSVYLWDSQTWGLKAKISRQRQSITSLSFDPKMRWLASASADSTVKIIDLASFAEVKSMKETGGFCPFVAFTNDETMMIATSKGIVRKWKVLPTPPDVLDPKLIVLQPSVTGGDSTVRTLSAEFDIQGLAYDDFEVMNLTINGRIVRLTVPGAGEGSSVPPGMKARRFSATVKLDSIGMNTYEIKATDKAGHTVTQTVALNRLSLDQAIEIIEPSVNAWVSTVSTFIRFKPWFEVEHYSIAVNLVDMVNNAVPVGKGIGDILQEDIPLVVGDNQVQLTVVSKQGDRFVKSFSVTRKPAGGVAAASPQGTQKKPRSSGPQAWAVVVGVSEYGSAGIPALKYADRDAEAFADFLRRPEGGGYDSDHLRILLNKDATLTNIKDALINFLGQAIDMDLVIIYFAGHGAPEPARPQNLYLLTHDSDPNMLGTTAFPMWQIQDVLARYINAKRIVVFSDACHSGGISVNFATRGIGVSENNLINQYLSDLSKTKEGTVVFTASAAGEVSQEFPELAHGAFTYYLLEGLEGKADFNNDYTITINEAMQYVEEQVKRKTKGAQNPTRSQTAYDKELTIATIAH